MAVKTEVELLDGIAIVHCTGRITLGEGSVAIRAVLTDLFAKERRRVVFDIADVPYMDSSGLGELVRGLSQATQAGGGLVLARAAERIKDVLRHTRLSTVFHTFDTVEEAIAHFENAHRSPAAPK